MNNPYDVSGSMVPNSNRSVVSAIGILLTFLTTTITVPILLLLIGFIAEVRLIQGYAWMVTTILTIMSLSQEFILLGSVLCFANCIYTFHGHSAGAPYLNLMLSSIFSLTMIVLTLIT